MEAADDYYVLLRRVRELGLEEQLRLLEDVAACIRQRTKEGAGRSILELQGLGQEIWRGVDATEYVARERASWDG